MTHVRIKDVKALIQAVKENDTLARCPGNAKQAVLGLISYYLGHVTDEDRQDVKNS